MSYASHIASRLALASVATALAIATACSDQQPTSPARAGSATTASSSPAVSSMTQVANPQAKPTDQVGFTTVEYISSENVLVGPGQSQQGLVLCPTGSMPTGGGFQLANVTGTTPVIWYSRLAVVGADRGWRVIVSNKQAGAELAQFVVDVVCVH